MGEYFSVYLMETPWVAKYYIYIYIRHFDKSINHERGNKSDDITTLSQFIAKGFHL